MREHKHLVSFNQRQLHNVTGQPTNTETTAMSLTKQITRPVLGITLHQLLRRCSVAGVLALGCFAFTGCQMDIAGQTLPSPHYLTDDVQYYAPGPEFKLAKEAAALKQQSEAVASSRQSN